MRAASKHEIAGSLVQGWAKGGGGGRIDIVNLACTGGRGVACKLSLSSSRKGDFLSDPKLAKRSECRVPAKPFLLTCLGASALVIE